MKLSRKRQKGQAMVEYIIIVVVIAIAAIAIFGAFSDRLRSVVRGATMTMGATDVDEVDEGSSQEALQSMTQDGLDE